MKFNLFRAVLFDWGNTLMHDKPILATSMASWPMVEMVAGADRLLASLQTRGLTLALATGALASDEHEIRLALARVELDQYIERIYCFANSGLRKPSTEYYQHILDDLRLSPAEVLMVGDSYDSDVLAPNLLGIPAVWYNAFSQERIDKALCATVHSLDELLARFEQDKAA